jgi:hypothetical protein
VRGIDARGIQPVDHELAKDLIPKAIFAFCRRTRAEQVRCDLSLTINRPRIERGVCDQSCCKPNRLTTGVFKKGPTMNTRPLALSRWVSRSKSQTASGRRRRSNAAIASIEQLEERTLLTWDGLGKSRSQHYFDHAPVEQRDGHG